MSPNNRIIVVFIVLLLLSGSIGIGRVPPTAAAIGARMRLWKLAREFGLKIMVCHLPPGTSKWNRIELRRFSFISQNWRGRPPRSPLIIVSLIGPTTTEAGLKVYCDVDENVHSRRIKVGDAEMKALDVRRAAFHGEWNYSLLPTPNTDAVVSGRALSPNAAELVRNDWARHHIIKGASTALLPLLEVLRDDPGPVPWGPTTPELAAAADEHLVNCGKWNAVQRLLELERYGLASTKFVSETHLIVEVEPDDEEFAEASCGHWLRTQKRETRRADEARLGELKPAIAANIDRYADVDDGWFLRYSSPAEIMRYHHEYAELYAFGIAEADALPESAVLDGRTFGDWTAASTAALGRVLHHIACATRLRATHASLELRNLLTVFARREDVTEIWLEAGETDDWAAKIIRGLTLDVPTAAHAVNTHEIPLPYYVDFGRHFLLLPIFGGLLNAHAGLVWHLQRSYRAHWARAVEAREQRFRSDLQQLFPPPRYTVPGCSFVVKRGDRTNLTDVDAVIIENHTGTLFLVQLKWPDIFGTSLAERDSRRSNLLKANDWVSRVSGWVGNRSSAEIANSFGLDALGPQSPVFLVVARHTARFSAEAKYDRRAHWISWPSLVRLRNEFPPDDLESLLRNAKQPVRLAHQPRRRPRIVHYQFPGLDVEARFS